MIDTTQKTVTTSGTPVQVATDTPVRSGTPVVVKAKKANSGDITVGKNATTALNTSGVNFKLALNEAVAINVDNLNQIWIDTTSSGDGVEVIFEPSL